MGANSNRLRNYRPFSSILPYPPYSPLFCRILLYSRVPPVLSLFSPILPYSPLSCPRRYSSLFCSIFFYSPLFFPILCCSLLFSPILPYSLLFSSNFPSSPLLFRICPKSPLFFTASPYYLLHSAPFSRILLYFLRFATVRCQ